MVNIFDRGLLRAGAFQCSNSVIWLIQPCSYSMCFGELHGLAEVLAKECARSIIQLKVLICKHPLRLGRKIE